MQARAGLTVRLVIPTIRSSFPQGVEDLGRFLGETDDALGV
jgi:hypothetical protein